MSDFRYDPHTISQIAKVLKNLKSRAKSQRDAVSILWLEKLSLLLDRGGYNEGKDK